GRRRPHRARADCFGTGSGNGDTGGQTPYLAQGLGFPSLHETQWRSICFHVMKMLGTNLPAPPLSVWVRYAPSALTVVVFCALRVGLPLEDSRFIIFVPPVFIASLLFGRSCGYYATALCAIAAEALILPPGGLLPAPTHLASLAIFLLVCLGISVVNHGLRRALVRVIETEAQSRLLLEELGHRVQNNLQMIIAVLTLQARRDADPRVQRAVDAAIMRIRVIAEAHDRLRLGRSGEMVEMCDYLRQLCTNLVDTVREVRPIALRVDCDPFTLPTEAAVPVGLIVNELVTNAFKHAFQDTQEGSVVVSLQRHHNGDLNLSIRDDGAGCSDDVRDGLGSRLVRMLVQQLNGTLERRPADGRGCEVRATLRPPGGGRNRLQDEPAMRPPKPDEAIAVA